MSLLSSVDAGLSKATKFLLSVITGAQNFAKIYSSLSQGVIAAVSAVFYDVVKDISASMAVVESAETANVPLTITLSSTTIALVKKTITDFKAGEAAVVADFKALDIKL